MANEKSKNTAYFDRTVKKRIAEISWILPCVVSHLNDPPLYLAVAWWAYYKKEPVSRNQISEAFRITPQQAGDTMEYILRKRTDFIHSQRVTNHRQNERMLIVTHILRSDKGVVTLREKREQIKPDKRVRTKQKEEIKALKNVLLSRRVGEKI